MAEVRPTPATAHTNPPPPSPPLSPSSLDPAPASRHVRSPRSSRRQSRDLAFTVVALITTLWALFQNFYRLGTAPILADEPTYTETAWRYLHGQVHPVLSSGSTLIATPDNFEHPPLAKYLFGLAQLIDGTPSSLSAARAVSALATVLAGVAVAVWIGRAAGRWTGLLAGALLTVLPEPAAGSLGRFDRFAMLDPVASMFMMFSVVAAWEWTRRTGRASWLWAVATGLAVGCAAGSKENGFLGAVGSVVFAVIIAAKTGRRAFVLRSAQAIAAIALSVLVFAALYLPVGDPLGRIRYLIQFQSAQSSAGHLIGFAGQVSSSPPWWANLWFAGHNFGPVLTVFLVVAALCAVVLRRDVLVGWCLAALAAPFVFHCFIASVALGYYWVMWTPLFLVLAALGAAEVIRRIAHATGAARAPDTPNAANATGAARRTLDVLNTTGAARAPDAVNTAHVTRVPDARNASHPPRLAIPLALVAGAAVLAVPLTDSINQSVLVAKLQPTGIMVVPKLMREHNLTGAVVSAGLPSWEWSYYLPNTTIYTSASGQLKSAEIIVLGRPQCRTLIDQSVRALVAINTQSGHVQQIYTDSAITAYAVTGALTTPTTAQINAEPPGKLTDNC
jgi:4-amino-4-deoxy-L-arabinose transferase-like glycosyltransferase